MRKILKTVLIILLIAFIIIQFIKPPENHSGEIPANQITARHEVPENVQQILKVSCYDCHSNTTNYPWYSQVQPFAWFLNDHIVEGKRELNFSTFSTYSAMRRYKKFKEIGKEVKDDEMPLFSYTLIHRGAVLNNEQRLAIENWAASSIKEMEGQYPADSLSKK